MRKGRKDGGNTEVETAWGEGGGARLRGTGDEQERDRGKKEKGQRERERDTEVGKGRREEREEKGERVIRTRKSRYRGKDRHTEEQIALLAQIARQTGSPRRTRDRERPVSIHACPYLLPPQAALQRALEFQARPFPAGQSCRTRGHAQQCLCVPSSQTH